MKNYLIAAISLILIGFGLVSYAGAEVTSPILLVRLGNVIKTYPYTVGLMVGGSLTQGGGITATSTSLQRATLATTAFDTEHGVDVNLTVRDTILDLPATSTLDANFVPTAGMSREILIRNSTTTVGIDLSISTTSTGYHLKLATTTSVVYGTTAGTNYAKLEFMRRSDSDIDVLATLFNN